MEYFIHLKKNSLDLNLNEKEIGAEASFMDLHKDLVVLRGQTFITENNVECGYTYLLNFNGERAAADFIQDHPLVRSNHYRNTIFYRCQNAMKQNMWEFSCYSAEQQIYLIIGYANEGMSEKRNNLLSDHRRYFIENNYQNKFIVRGPLWSESKDKWMGSEFVIQLQDCDSVNEFLAKEPYTHSGLYKKIDVYLIKLIDVEQQLVNRLKKIS